MNPPGTGPTPYGSDPSPTQPTPIVFPGVPPQPPPLGPGPGRPPVAGYDHRQGFWASHLLARLLAFVVDIPGIAFILSAFGFDLVDRGSLALAPRHDVGGWTLLVLASLGIALLFAFLCEAIFGTTLGKMLFMLHVRRVDGKREGFGRAILRYLLLPLDLLLIGPLLAAITPKHRRLGDFASGTVVGRSPLGPLATAISVVVLGVLGYAQAAYGGGFTSAVGVSAETASYLPIVLGNLALPAGLVGPRAEPSPTPFAFASASPSALETAPPASLGGATSAPASSAAPESSAEPQASAAPSLGAQSESSAQPQSTDGAATAAPNETQTAPATDSPIN